ncbi:MAG: HesA/MoeB/ThiF family protein [Blastocatellia bacterium]
MSDSRPQKLVLAEGRFARLEAIEWWDQSLLGQSRLLVIGAGALGNEVIKNLALLGVGHLVVVDMDRVELSNLSRSVLFRAEDEGKPKAECAAQAARYLYPDIRAQAIVGNVMADVGLGYFRWADVVVGALDNREARVFVNSACARTARTWFDGGLDVLQGIVRGFAPPASACYECTMSQVDWELLNRRRSCSLLARRALAERGTPTTPTVASIIAGIQAQEVVKQLHGLEALVGRGFVFEGKTHNSFTVSYTISPDCTWHDPVAAVVAPTEISSATRLETVWRFAAERLGGVDAIDFSRELVESLECAACGRRDRLLAAAEKISEEQARCPVCGAERTPHFFHSIAEGSELLAMTIGEIGLPLWDILWVRRGEAMLGIEVAGDREQRLEAGD